MLSGHWIRSSWTIVSSASPLAVALDGVFLQGGEIKVVVGVHHHAVNRPGLSHPFHMICQLVLPGAWGLSKGGPDAVEGPGGQGMVIEILPFRIDGNAVGIYLWHPGRFHHATPCRRSPGHSPVRPWWMDGRPERLRLLPLSRSTTTMAPVPESVM